VVTVDRNVDVPAFNESGQRDVVSLKAGTVFRESRPYDSRHLICASRQGTRGMFYVVPRDVVTVRADEVEEEVPSFEEYVERADKIEPGTGTSPMAVSPTLEIPEQELREMFFYDPSGQPLGPRGPYEYDYLAEPAGQRFVYMRVPVQIGRSLSPEFVSPATVDRPAPRMPKGQAYDAYVLRSERRQVADDQDPTKKRTVLAPVYRFYRFMPKVLDTKTGKTFAVQDKADAQRQAERIVALEEEMAGPETTPHGMFQLRRTPDPQGTYLYEITVPGSPPLQEEPLRSLKEAQGYVDESLERLLDKAAPYLTKA
jgi:hypothetical protein